MAALTEQQQENEQLKQDFDEMKFDFDKNLSFSAEQIKATVQEVVNAAAASGPGRQAFDKRIDSMAQMIMKDKQRVAQLAEVQETKSLSRTFSDIELHDLHKSPSPAASSSTIQRLSRFITKANKA